MISNKSDIDDYNRIGLKIKMLRERVGWSQSQLAKKINAVPPTISAIEKGHYPPSLIIAKKICYLFNISLDDLIGNEMYDYKKIEKKSIDFYTKYKDIEKLSSSQKKIISEIIECFISVK